MVTTIARPRQVPAMASYGTRRYRVMADVAGVLMIGTVVALLALWLGNGGVATFAETGGVATALGRLAGLVAADLLLIQVLLMARIPFVERAWGQDVLTRRHRLVGFLSFFLMLAHIGLIVAGYTIAGSLTFPAQVWDLVANYPGMLLAVAGTAALIAVVVTSIRAARRRLRYESWHLIHLYAYLGVALVLPHQLWSGADFIASPGMTVFWWALWGVAAAAIVTFRILLPLGRSALHRIVVDKVVVEGPGVVSVLMSGRRLHLLHTRAGQYFQWRFLDGKGWSRAHPFSVSALPVGDRLRITLRTSGDEGARLARLRRGTRVIFEGPYGALTSERRHHRDVLLIAAGVGITPVRSLAEQIAAEPRSAGPDGVRRPSVVIIHRVSTRNDELFADEWRQLASKHGVRMATITGPRGRSGGWLPNSVDTRRVIADLAPDIADREVYLCGPRAWMTAVRADLLAAGVNRKVIHHENFGV